MLKRTAVTLSLALAITVAHAPAAMADDVPFVKKLLEAAERGKAVIQSNQGPRRGAQTFPSQVPGDTSAPAFGAGSRG